ncbi:IclR family transcriptional regulator [Microbacterium sediminis]|uniref:Glycerol operon regulatory protein n=1 Tax=Microbacterium sediminis TaxID=904291 RepID=A0A1B9NIH4_9MICO|nr:IclR family transcriptional regulator [Microbacterium sediminis]QBR75296.1 IclR family transcriptional regulator [Microbacterium sediminis]
MTAAQRVLAILETFDHDHILLTLSEISRRSGLSLSTTHRLVGELRAWGALERSDDGRYAIGMRVLELGSLEPQGLRLRAVALPYLSDLHGAIAADVNLSVRDGDDVVYVESLRSRRGAPVLTRLGGRWPLHATGTGQVLLAHAAPEVQDRVLSRPLKRFTPKTVTDPDEMRRTLADVRTRGYAVVDESITAGAIAIAVPVRAAGERVVAAVGVTIKRGSCPPQSVLPALSMTARAISRGMGSAAAKERMRA